MSEIQIIYILLAVLIVVGLVATAILAKRQGSFTEDLDILVKQQDSVMKDLGILKNKDTGMIIANVVKEKVAKDLSLEESQIDVSQIQDMKALRISDLSDRELCCIDFDVPQNYSINSPLSSDNKQLKNLLENILGEGLKKSDVFVKALKNNKMFIAKFSDEVTRGLTDGTYKLIQNGAKLEAYAAKTGKFKEIATSVGPAGGVAALVNPVMIIVAAWQLMATITLQHYLTSMDDKMTSVLQGIWDLKYKLNNDRLGKIESAIHYLNMVQNRVKKGYVNQENVLGYLSQYESIERDCWEVIYACNFDISSYIHQILAKVNNEQSMEECVDYMGKTIDEYNYLQNAISAAEYTLIVLEQGRSVLGVDSDQIKDDYDSIKDLINQQNNLIIKNKTALFDGINKLKGGLLTRSKTEIAYQDKVKSYFGNYEKQWLAKSDRIKSEIEKQIEIVSILELKKKEPLSLAVKFDENLHIDTIGIYS